MNSVVSLYTTEDMISEALPLVRWGHLEQFYETVGFGIVS